MTEFERWILSTLNEEQAQAVRQPRDATVIVHAGAGTGKTRLLSTRIAWLASGERAIGLGRIAALTFTVKAAKEMSDRLLRILIGESAAQRPEGAPWPMMGTFHGIAARLLRRHAESAAEIEGRRLTERYTVLDAEEQVQAIRQAALDTLSESQVQRGMRLDAKHARIVAQALERTGRKGATAHDLAEELDGHEIQVRFIVPRRRRKTAEAQAAQREQTAMWGDEDEDYEDEHEGAAGDVVRAYWAYKGRQDVVDYTDLVPWAVRLLRDDPHATPRLEHVLVDECQDTDPIQRELTERLRGAGAGLTAVGDPDQLIYGWRGARIEDCLSEAARPETTVLALTVNYRSPPEVLRVANRALAGNRQRTGKALRPLQGRAEGQIVRCHRFRNAQQEARWIAEGIHRSLPREGRERVRAARHYAVLARRSRTLDLVDNALASLRVPYQVVAGRKFLLRGEIREIGAWVQLLINPDNDQACETVIQRWAKGWGEKSMDELREAAAQLGQPMIRCLSPLIRAKRIKGVAARSGEALLTTYRELGRLLDRGKSAREMIRAVMDLSGMQAEIDKGLEAADEERQIAAKGRADRLADLIALAGDMRSVTDLHEHLALSETAGQEHDGVVIGTIHGAKGREFPMVIVPGMERYNFPAQGEDEASGPDPGALSEAERAEREEDRIQTVRELEEDRRVLHVACTRAQQRLAFTWAERRRGAEMEPSPFLEELGDTIRHIDHTMETPDDPPNNPNKPNTESPERATEEARGRIIKFPKGGRRGGSRSPEASSP